MSARFVMVPDLDAVAAASYMIHLLLLPMTRPPVKAAIRAISSYLPETILDNEMLAAEFADWTPEKILEKTGIRTRRIAAPDECSSDLGVRAAENLFEQQAIQPEEVDYLLFCTQTPDYFLPTTACLMQDRLGLRTDCGAIDFNQGCSGFVYGLSLAKGLIESGTATNVLLVTAETYSKFINRRDRSVRTVFGDGAAATLITGVETDEELIGPFVFGTDGRGAANLIVPTGGMRRPITDEARVEREEGGNWRSEVNLYMNGPEIFNFTLRTIPPAVQKLLGSAGMSIEDVDYFIFHQANRFMLDRLRNKMGIVPEKFALEMESCGNTVSSTIPIALERSAATGALKPNSRIMAVGFGVGYSWAAAMIRALPGTFV
jgi:3-oxoacyl-[acyl-carrier-protein] synthase-3